MLMFRLPRSVLMTLKPVPGVNSPRGVFADGSGPADSS